MRRHGRSPSVDGVLVIDKPEGPTSHTIVTLVRRTLGLSRVGHTGTLDPLATGVLPLVLGRATRLAQFLSSAEKTYDATLRLGWATDTYDRTGTRVELAGGDAGATLQDCCSTGGDAGATLPGSCSTGGDTGATLPSDTELRARVERALERFRGTVSQTPPSYSAKMIDGVRSYDLARTNRAVSPAAVAVTAHEITVVECDSGRVRLLLRCSAGYYVRALAHDLGAMLGGGAHLESLRRLRSGSFTLADAVGAADLARAPEDALARVIPIDALLPDWPSATVTPLGLDRVRHGNPVHVSDLHEPSAGLGLDGALWRLSDQEGHLLAIARAVTDLGAPALHPFLVLLDPS